MRSEIIIVNDGSTDNSVRVVEEYTQKICGGGCVPVFVINQENKVQEVARNLGLKREGNIFHL